jgi:hypothetical protein
LLKTFLKRPVAGSTVFFYFPLACRWIQQTLVDDIPTNVAFAFIPQINNKYPTVGNKDRKFLTESRFDFGFLFSS